MQSLFHITNKQWAQFLIGVTIATTLSSSIPTIHAESTGNGTITIHQESSFLDVLGKWSLVKPDGTKKISGNQLSTIQDLPEGRYSMFVNPPEGSLTTIQLFMNGEEIEVAEIPQITFELGVADSATIEISYVFERTGDLLITTDPPGMGYTLRGPNNVRLTGNAPGFYEDLPVGQYSVEYDELEGCNYPPTQSQKIIENGRASFSLDLQCDAADVMRDEYEFEELPDRVTVEIGGKKLVFRDTPTDSWFAPFVYIVAKKEIMSGTKDRAGNFTGEFNPAANVTLAQLSKIAHEVADVDETKVSEQPINPKARNAWFSQYFASAERNGWVVFIEPNVAPSRYATRAEVVSTLLQAFSVRRHWATGTMFNDVSPRTPHASSVETAVLEGLVEGYKDDQGNDLKQFGPSNNITRAEMAKVVARALELYVEIEIEIEE